MIDGLSFRLLTLDEFEVDLFNNVEFDGAVVIDWFVP